MIASHAGYRFGSPEVHAHRRPIARITARDGVVGLILAQHQINDGIRRSDTKTLAESLAVLDRHIEAIGPDHVAIGSDLDGFIKPTIGGVESAADLKPFADALRARHPESADRILRDNALRDHRAAIRSALTPRISRQISPRAWTTRSSTESHSGQRSDGAHAGLVDLHGRDGAGLAAAGAGGGRGREVGGEDLAQLARDRVAVQVRHPNRSVLIVAGSWPSATRSFATDSTNGVGPQTYTRAPGRSTSRSIARSTRRA